MVWAHWRRKELFKVLQFEARSYPNLPMLRGGKNELLMKLIGKEM
jgi:hypothetical protein